MEHVKCCEHGELGNQLTSPAMCCFFPCLWALSFTSFTAVTLEPFRTGGPQLSAVRSLLASAPGFGAPQPHPGPRSQVQGGVLSQSGLVAPL